LNSTTLLVAFCGVAKRSLKLPVRTKQEEALSLLAAMTAEDLFDSALKVVIAQAVKDAAEVMKGELMSFEKGLLRGSLISAMKGGTRSHTAQGDELQGHHLASQLDRGFIPIDLRLTAPGVGLRHTDFALRQPEFVLAVADIPADGAFGNLKIGMFVTQPTEDAMGGVALFARCLEISLQNLINELFQRFHLRLFAGCGLAFGRDGRGQGLTNHAAMNAELASDT
jgi:hypothetical protein